METRDFREHYRRNFTLAYPVMLSQLGHVFVGVADSVMVGQLGAVPLASVSLGGGVFHVVMLFAIGVSYAVTPLVASADGEQNYKKCASLLKHGFIVNMILGIVLAVTLSFSSGVFELLRSRGDGA